MQAIAKSRNERAGVRESNLVAIDNVKGEMISFRRRRKSEINRRISKTRITICGYTIGFNSEATRWISVYLDTGL